MTTVHASPTYQMAIATLPPDGYPMERVDDTFVDAPDGSNFESRRRAFLDHCLQNPAPNNTKTIYYELARQAAGGVAYEGAIAAALDYIDARKDCSDFVLHGVLRMLYQFGGQRFERKSCGVKGGTPGLSEETLARGRATVLGFKYWPDEPGVDSLCTWTENHYILYSSAAYLAGQLYPDQTFSNAGQTGNGKMVSNRPRILRWLDLRFHTGFSEWLSHVYYDEDLTALLSLIDFCQDEEIVVKATMVRDLLLLDMALNSYRGVFGSTHGRSYANTKKWAANESMTDTAKLLFGMGVYSAFDNMSAVAFVLSENYTLPPVLAAIANDLEQPEMENRQRMGIRLDEMERWGLGVEDFEDGMHLLTLEAYMHPRTAALTLHMFDAFNWWGNDFFASFKSYRPLISGLRRTRTLRRLARSLEWDLCRNTREEVNVLTYRTPDYMLSCAQDYRAGYGGDQQHIWQATLGNEAVCFTTHPAKIEGVTPNYWEGSGQLPRAAQVNNVVICIYHLHKKPALYVPTRLFFTHAWLPQDKFDEVIEQDGWVFACKGQGYLALRSQQPYRWQDRSGEDQGREIIADGRSNIWICEMGREITDGSFAAFCDRIAEAELAFDGVNVVFHSPSQGKLEFGWTGPLRLDGREIALSNYPRYLNPYVKADFATNRIDVCIDQHYLHLDWRSLTRQFE